MGTGRARHCCMRISPRYVLGCIALMAGAGLAARYLPVARRSRLRDDRDDARVDEASEDSFPASDPPSFTGSATTNARAMP